MSIAAQVAFSSTILLLLVLERFLNAASVLLTALVLGRENFRVSEIKAFASIQMLGAGASLITSVASAAASAVLAAIPALLTYAFWAFTATLVFAVLYVAQEYYPSVMIGAVDYWNEFLGGYIHTAVVVPLRIVDIAFSAVTPAYNLGTWVASQFLHQSLVPTAIQNVGPVVDFAKALAGFFKHTFVGLSEYLPTFATACPQPITDACYDPGRRVYDFITPMADARGMALAAREFARGMCAGVTGPADIALYPLLDINAAKAVHNIGNAALYTLIHIPSVTVQRCKNQGGDLIMCLPDFEPPLNMLVAGLRNLGDMLDNWLDVTSIIVQETLIPGSTPTCAEVPLALTSANYSRDVFGPNERIRVVGLTEGLYAVTDGTDIQYFNHYGATESVVSVAAWPFPVDVSMGVAAVTYHDDNPGERDTVGNPSTAMLGCACEDTESEGMAIRCAIALYEDSTARAAYNDTSSSSSSSGLPVFRTVFHKRSTAKYMTCAGTEISVQSVRWPATRFTRAITSERDLETTCQSKLTCNYVDATIWVAPLCSSSSTEVSRACIASFKDAACFPYCMAARRSGSGHDGLVLYNAPDWRDRVHLMDRDCAVDTQITSETAIPDLRSGRVAYLPEGESSPLVPTYTPGGSADASVANDPTAAAVRTTAWDPDLGCSLSANARSTVGVDAMPGYSGGGSNAFRSILLPTQPFAFAGDTALTPRVSASGEFFVSVDRLFGNEGNEFTMVSVQREYPAAPPADTPAEGARMAFDADKLPIPYAFSGKTGVRHPAASSQSAVYFAVNPSLAMFRGFAKGCITGGQVWQTQLSALSSYAPLRIWKVDAYAFCPHGVGTGKPYCDVPRPKSVAIPGAFMNETDGVADAFNILRCDATFSVEVEAIEYINAENMAVTVLEASLKEYDIETGMLIPNAKSARRRVYFMSTATMQLGDTPFSRDFQAGRLAQGTLCPAMRRLPNVGSLNTELLAALVNVARPVVNLAVSLPGLIQLWGQGRACPIATHGHSLLRRCGRELLSLEDAFDSMERANAHFWAAFGIVATRIRDLGEENLANVVDGVAYFGEGTSMAVGGRARFMLRSFRIPFGKVSVGVMNAVLPPGARVFSSASFVTSNPLRVARFSYGLITGAVADVIPLAVRLERDKRDRGAARELVRVFTNRLYDARQGYYNAVTLSLMQGCSGASLMLGYTTPWAVLLRKQCEASAVAMQGAFDALLAILVNVPFAKCLCVDAGAAGANFESYAMENCFYFAPTNLKPLMLGMVQRALLPSGGAGGGVEKMCADLTEFAASSMSTSMGPYFALQLQANEQIASSIDYLIRFLDPNAGKCMDFAGNPYATVLVPEPMDYFAACARTSMCALKCDADFRAFDDALTSYANAQALSGAATVISSQQESRFFEDLNEDAYTPMHIVAMVELSDCRRVCGGSVAHDADGRPPENADTCIAIAGVAANASVQVRKYCVPRAISVGVWSQPTESWGVWYSEPWSDTLLDLQFTDTIYGDAIVAYRDNRGGDAADGPREQFVSIHPRYVQALDGGAFYAGQYATAADRSERLTLLSGIAPTRAIAGVDRTTHDVLALTDVKVIPSAARSSRPPWLLMSMVVVARADADTTSITDSHEVDVCGAIDVDALVESRGEYGFDPAVCDLASLLQIARGGSYIPVHFPSPGGALATLALVPTLPGYDMYVVSIPFIGGARVGPVSKRTLPTPASFTSNTKIPTGPSWEDFTRTSMLVSNSRLGSSAPKMTQQGVVALSRRVLAQNTLVSGDFLEREGQLGTVTVFCSNDPDAPSHWLTQVRMRLAGGSAASARVLVSDVRASHTVNVTVSVIHACDRTSCLGCSDLRLQTLCYAARQCSVTRCIGTVVNQKFFLCDAGLAMQSIADQAVAQTLGAWLIFTETYTEILRLSLSGGASAAQGIEVQWVDDAFFGYVCSAKDMYGQLTGALTAAVGAGLIYSHQASGGSTGADAGAADVDNRYTATVTLILNGVNSFLYQLALFPLYPMIATQKVFVCSANSMLALISATGFNITLGRADLQAASARTTGECLTSYYESASDDTASPEARASLASGANEILSNVGSAARGAASLGSSVGAKISSRLSAMQMKVPMHYLDAVITWAMGVVSGLQDMTQVLDAQHCDVPDYFIHTTTTCACGDDPAQIPLARRQSSDYWCTGTLRMLDGFGAATYVYNPHTFEQLRGMLDGGRMDAYLLCISRHAQLDDLSQDCSSIRPQDQVITPQGVSLIAVFQRCKANYQQRQWDEGAFLIHDPDGLSEFIRGINPPPARPADDPQGVGACLLRTRSNEEGNLGCLQEHAGMDLAVYWRYERIDLATADTANIDACLVFSGPARSATDEEVALEFKRCSADYMDSGCRIPHMVWSAASRNKVPVANLHMIDATTEAGREATALRHFAEARDLAIGTLDALLGYANEKLNVVLFSGEGDSLHQVFDCIVQGPYARVDLWAKGSERNLPVPFWARDAGGLGISRKLDLPCNQAKLKGDLAPPFTCGSDTRRSIIKTFVRNYINGDDGAENGNTFTEALIRQRIADLRASWANTSAYACVCEGESPPRNSLACCRRHRAGDPADTAGCVGAGDYETSTASSSGGRGCVDNFLPATLNVSFDEIHGDDVIRAIVESIPGYLAGIFTHEGSASTSPFRRHNDARVVASWDWGAGGTGLAEAARADGLYTSYSPVVEYTAGEAGHPFRGGAGVWRMCAGLISQVMMTMPVAPLALGDDSAATGDWMWTASTVLGMRSPAFDPAAATAGGIEAYVERLLADSFSRAPTFWHYAARHVPSDSLACARYGDHGALRAPPGGYMQFEDNLAGAAEGIMDGIPPDAIPMHGYAAFALGSVGAVCLCGWGRTAGGACVMPAAVCLALRGASPPSPACEFDAGDQAALAEEVAAGWRPGADGWECPDMDLSDAWGVATDTSSDLWISRTPDLLAGNLTMGVTKLLASGRAGLRVGNADTMGAQARREGVDPSRRLRRLQAPGGGGSVALRACEGGIMRTFDTASVVESVVQDLFPAAQAVRESAPISTCLRYSIEYARVRMYEAIAAAGIRDTSAEQAAAEPSLQSWRRRCEAQLDLIGVCRSNRVFEMIPPAEPAGISCPFTVSDAYAAGGYYVTPGCAVYVKAGQSTQPGLVGAFYDPCRHPSAPCEPPGGGAVSLADLLADTQPARLPFDPRATGARDALGSWPESFLAPTDEANARQADARDGLASLRAERTGDEIPWRLEQEFVAKVVDAGGSNAPGAAGNTRGAWGTAEGKDGDAGEYCDGIADWWPEDWSMPSGYHVTLPCDSQQAGYRTFDAAFAVERPDGTATVTMRYLHTALRDPDLYHSAFGAAGFCRRGAYGMPPVVTNTMRVCTTDSVGVQYDAAVPVRPRFANGTGAAAQEWDDEHCAGSPYDVPWTIDDPRTAHPSMFAVGTVPMYRGEPWDSSPSTLYPLTDRDAEILNTHPGTRDTSWGKSCTDGELLRCANDTDCEPLEGSQAALRCFRGVCVLADSVTCYRHADCEPLGLLCSADGRCVEGVWQVENTLDGEDIDFDLYAGSCSPPPASAFAMQPYEMYGASPWQHVPGILELFGMCSYRNWYEYLELIDPQDREDRANADGVCDGALAQSTGCTPGGFDIDTSSWWDTARPHNLQGSPSIREGRGGAFLVRPHPCDRDYMHIEGTAGCAPRVLNDNSAMGIVAMDGGEGQSFELPQARRARNAQTIERIATTGEGVREFLRMAGRPGPLDLANATFRQLGFLGVKSIYENEEAATPTSRFRDCKTIPQCFLDVFTFHGSEVDRESTTNSAGVEPWKAASGDACGSFGIRVDPARYPACDNMPGSHTCCLLDGSVAPLYRMLCGPGAASRRITVSEDAYDGGLDAVVTRDTEFPSARAYLQERCNAGPFNPFSPGGNWGRLDLGEVDAACAQIGADVYTVYKDIVDKRAKALRLGQIRDALNMLTDAFVPSGGASHPPEAAYLAATSCSVALHAALRATTACPAADVEELEGVGALNPASAPPPGTLNPFCTKYHRSAGGAAGGGLYYFLTHTLQEFPLAWWHKCMALHNRRFSAFGSQLSVIHCPEWRDETIPAKDLDTTRYSESTMGKLRRVEAGITYATLQSAYHGLVRRLQGAVSDYVQGGNPFSPAQPAGLARQGVPSDYTISCDTGIQYLGLQEMRTLRNTTRVDCMMDVLDWTFYKPLMHDEALFESSRSWGSNARGVDPRCYRPDPSTRSRATALLSGTSFPTPSTPLGFIESTLRGSTNPDPRAPSPLQSSIVGNLFSQANTNHPTLGVLVGEFIPPAPPVPSGVVASRARRAMGFTATAAMDPPSPCITFDEVKERLQECPSDVTGLSDLTSTHCHDAFSRGEEMIREYSKPIWRRNEGTGDLGRVHAGLDNSVRDRLITLLEVHRDDCITKSRDGGMCYEYNNPRVSLEREISSTLGMIEKSVSHWDPTLDPARAQAEASILYSQNRGYTRISCSNTWRDNVPTQKCEVIWETTQNPNVDQALQRLYDASTSTTWESWLHENVVFLLNGIVGPLFSFVVTCDAGQGYGNKCLPQDTPVTDRHFTADKTCFNIYRPSGLLSCLFDSTPSTGLQAEIAAARAVSGARLTSPRTESQTAWAPLAQMLLPNLQSGETGYEVEMLPELIHTLYTRLAHTLLADDAASSAYVKPQPLAIHTEAAGFKDAFHLFDITPRRRYEERIEKYLHDCEYTDQIIQYRTCADNFLGVYNRAAQAMHDSILREGATVIPARSVLVWPGASLAQHLGVSVPAWSRSDRNRSHVFAQWVFNSTEQCALGNEDNSVCTLVGQRETTCPNYWSGNASRLGEGETCYPAIGEMVAVNPWLAGDFNPWELCDTSASSTVDGQPINEAISSSCHPYICNDNHKEYLDDMPNAEQCRNNHGRSVPQANVNYGFQNNLCRRQPPDPGPACLWDQGQAMLGASGEKVDTLYRTFDAIPETQWLREHGQGLFVHGGNPLYYTSKAPTDRALTHAILRQGLEDLGGHHVVLRVAADPLTGERYMHVDRTPLAAVDIPARGEARVSAFTSQFRAPAAYVYDESRRANATHGAFGWLRNLGPDMAAEARDIIDPLYPVRAPGEAVVRNSRWLCPLRRMAFWSQLTSFEFNPLVPSPPRAARMFTDSGLAMAHGTRSHPAQRFRSLGRLANVLTSNGFCFCTSSADCRVANGRAGDCTLLSTIKSLYDRRARPVTMLRPLGTPPCGMQLDWPHEGGEMRDGTISPGRNDAAYGSEKCNVFDRLPPFKYSYKPVGAMHVRPEDAASRRTSVDEGGSCHMGPAARLPTPPQRASYLTRDCRTIEKNRTHVVLRCEKGNVADEDVVMPREASRPPTWMIEHMATVRQRCGLCSPTPTWVSEAGTNELPAGPEVSYGRPFRWASARVIAADIKRALCGGLAHNNTPECESLMSVEQWKLERFLGALVSDPESLLSGGPGPANGTTATPRDTLPQGVVRGDANASAIEDLLWDGPDAAWVACNQANYTCYGGIPKDAWYGPNRGTECVSAFQRQVEMGNVNSSTVGIDICDIDSSLNDMCINLATARNKVIEGNCMFVGACSPQMYTYTPGMYSITNEDFVRGTVTAFYEQYGRAAADDTAGLRSFLPGDNAGRVCPVDAQQADLERRNADYTARCASVQLERMQYALRIARRLVNLIVRATWYFNSLVLAVLRLLIPLGGGVMDDVIAEIQFWFTQLLTLVFESVKEIANLFFRLIFDEGGFGSAMKVVIQTLCDFMNFVLTIWEYTGCVILKDIVSPIIGFFIDILDPVISFFASGSRGIITLLRDMNRNIANINCKYRLDCLEPHSDRVGRPNASLPVATRCWADYVPGVDSTDTFSCTRSDTCKTSDLNIGVTADEFGGLAESGREVLCNSCPIQMGGYINQFGCDTHTRQCTCNVPKRDRTYCTANEQCFVQGDSPATCALVNDFTTGTSFGTTECQACAGEPTCHITDRGLGVGVCSCMQTFTPVLSCKPSGVGARAFPDASRMCAVSTDMGAAMRTASVYQSWGSLATAPCALLSSGNSYCYNVGGYGYLVVGHGISVGGAGRRLLWAWNGTGGDGRDGDWPGSEGEEDATGGGAEPTGATVAERVAAFGDDWSHTAEPCASLARVSLGGGAAGAGLGVLDAIALEHCAHWRGVGEEFISRFNLTGVLDARRDGHLLLSIRDLASVVGRRGGALKRVVGAATSRDGVRFLVSSSPRAGSLMQLLVGGAELIARFLGEAEALARGGANATAAANSTAAEVAGRVAAKMERVGSIMPFLEAATGGAVPGRGAPKPPSEAPGGAAGEATRPMATRPRAEATTTATTGRRAAGGEAGATTTPAESRAARRALLQAEGNLDVQEYSSLTSALGNVDQVPLSARVAEAWLEGPFAWPPRFEYWDAKSSCAVYETVRDSVVISSGIVGKYYTQELVRKAATPPWDFSANLPRLYNGTPPVAETGDMGDAAGNTSYFGGNPRDDPMAAFYNFFVVSILDGWLGVTPAKIQAFFTSGKGLDPDDELTLGNVVREMLVCDFESVVMCSRHRRNIVMSFVMSYLIYWAVDAALSAIRIRGLSTVAWMFVPTLAMWMAYGVSPVCLPMIPTCIVADIIDAVDVVIPVAIVWPDALQKTPNCLGQLAPDGTISVSPSNHTAAERRACMRSCREHPFYFRSWESSLAWVACGVGPDTCAGLDIPYFPDFNAAAVNISRAFSIAKATGVQDPVNALAFCFWTTLGQALPWFFIALTAVYLAVCLASIPMQIAGAYVQVVATVIAYTHVGMGGGRGGGGAEEEEEEDA